MSLGQEVVVLFAGAKGFLDKLDINRLKDYEAQLLSFVEGKYPAILAEIDDKKVISPELEKTMKDALTEFETVFVTA